MRLLPPSSNQVLNCAGKLLVLGRAHVMGVINITPDSFYAPSRSMDLEEIYLRAKAMVEQGASIIDVGAETTRPGAGLVSVQEELDRVIPTVELLARELTVPISVDTSQAQVIREAIAHGAGMINDVRGLRLPGALEAVANSDIPVCLMHMGYPDTTQAPTVNTDDDTGILAVVVEFLSQRVNACEQAGIARERLLLDPGLGNGSFGKSTAQNLYILNNLQVLHALGLPILVGLSRKTFIGDITNKPPAGRLAGSLACHVFAWLKGATFFRTHDVAETVDALKMLQAITKEE
jgi:dihydropteroate synthase